jgi:hypothetical protein
MEVKERKEVTEFKIVTIARKCDVCGKVHEGKYTPDEWHTFSHSHNEWANDSIDSVEHHEVCSAECYWVKFNECVKDLSGRVNASIDSFEIQFARLLIDSIKK